jgi:DNA-binding PadR family transcriptional regulator
VSRRKLLSRPGATLTSAVFYILLSLSVQDRHGYDILKDVALSSAGRMRMGPAVLYTNLKRMLEAGLIVEVEAPAGADDERRRYYRLTREGRAELATELERMEHTLKVARARRVRSPR